MPQPEVRYGESVVHRLEDACEILRRERENQMLFGSPKRLSTRFRHRVFRFLADKLQPVVWWLEDRAEPGYDPTEREGGLLEGRAPEDDLNGSCYSSGSVPECRPSVFKTTVEIRGWKEPNP